MALRPEDLRRLTHNADEWFNYLWTEIQRQESEIEYDLASVAFSETIHSVLEILQEELMNAAMSTEEFSQSILLKPLQTAFNSRKLINYSISDRRITIRQNVEYYLGSYEEFFEGVEFARGMIQSMSKSGKRLPTAEQRARYWKEHVYPYSEGVDYQDLSDILENTEGNEEDAGDEQNRYLRTMAWRFQNWGGNVPYWVWLEDGNTSFDGAHPSNDATHFIYKAENRATSLFRVSMGEQRRFATTLLENALVKFVENPENFEQFDVLGSFFAKGREYRIYVTRTRQIGVALPSTIAREMRR